MISIFDSRDTIYRNPTGAVSSGSKIHFKIILPRNIHCSGANLTIIADDNMGSEYLSMFWCGMYDDEHEMWECDYVTKDPKIYWYFFEIDTLYGKKKINKMQKSSKGQILDGYSWQLTVFKKDFETPAWLSGGIMYQIFPDRFNKSNYKKDNVPKDRTIHKNWSDDPVWEANDRGEVTNSDYFGGDLQGITDKIGYLKKLGVTCIYLNPIFEAHSNHRYNTANYENIDPLLGTIHDFNKLANKFKKNGIRVIIDGVFSHTGSDSIYFNKNNRYNTIGAYNSLDSIYSGWYNFIKWPEQYQSWWGFDSLPETDECNNSYINFINGKDGIIRKWLKEGASGWRLDVADELPDFFIESLREAAKAENPDSLILGEVWEDASNKESYGHRRKFLLGKQLDTVMNYPFRDAILGFFTGSSGVDMAEIICSVLENYPKPVIRILMNILGTHDTERAITILAGKPINGRDKKWQSVNHLNNDEKKHGIKLIKAASAMQFTLPGVPCIYYGDETGLEGYKDPFNRRCYPWKNQNAQLIKWYKQLGIIRKSCSCLNEGDFRLIKAEQNLIVYTRSDAYTSILCAFNSSNNDITIDVPKCFFKGKNLLNSDIIEKQLTIPAEGCSLIFKDM